MPAPPISVDHACETFAERIRQLEALLEEKQKIEAQLRREIQTRKELEDRLRSMAMSDALTGVPNRRQILGIAGMEISRARRYGRPMSLLLLDIDHFKTINDVHGHAVGDEALVHLASVGSGALRESDTLGRTGGEEFVVVLPETPAEGALVVADRLRQIIATTPAPTASGPLTMTLSIGVAEVSRGESIDAVMQRADQAMYAAKESGRNRCCVAAPVARDG